MRGKPFVERKGYSKLEATRALYVSGTAYISGTAKIRDLITENKDCIFSGNLVVLGKVYDGDSNLILSSAVGSVIAASGVLEFPLDANSDSAHIISKNSPLILSSSYDSIVTVSGAIKMGPEMSYFNSPLQNKFSFYDGTNGIIADFNSNNMRLRNLADGADVELLAKSTEFPSDALPTYGHVVAQDSDLILSSSVGSNITVSGTFMVTEGTNYGTIRGGNIYLNNAIRLSTETAGTHGLQITEQDGTVAELWVDTIKHNGTQTIDTGAGTTITQNKDTEVNGACILKVNTGTGDEFTANGNGENQFGIALYPKLNQGAGVSAKFTDFRISTTETQVGGAGHDFADWQIGGVTKFRVINDGTVRISGSYVSEGSDLILSSSGPNSNVHISGSLTMQSYQRHIYLSAQNAFLGPTAPSFANVGTFRALCFDSNAETVNFMIYIPLDWDGISDFQFKTIWTNQPGTPISDGETVMTSIGYRVKDFIGGDVIDGGNVTKKYKTYTQSGDGTDKEGHYCVCFNLDVDDSDNPIEHNKFIGIEFSRSFSVDSYGADMYIYGFGIAYSASQCSKMS